MTHLVRTLNVKTGHDGRHVVAELGMAMGDHTTVTDSDEIVTGLSVVDLVMMTPGDPPVANADRMTATPGDQAGSPAAGSVLIESWKPTGAGNTTPTPATEFGKACYWVAFGKP